MLLLEVILPKAGKRLYVSVSPKTKIDSVIRRLCDVTCQAGHEAYLASSLVDLDEMYIPNREKTVMEAGLVNGSRLVFITECP